MDTTSAEITNLDPTSLGALFDPLEPEQMEDPYPLYARARREEPVFYSPKYGFWVVTRHADLCTLLRDTATFSSAGALEAQKFAPEVLAVLETGYVEFESLVQSDEPDHTRMRNVFNKALSPQRVAAMEGVVRAIAGELIDSFVAEGEADLATRFAYPLPGSVICHLLGVPRTDVALLKPLSNSRQALLAANVPLPIMIACARDFITLQRYFVEHLESRAREPKDDLLTLLVPAEIGGTAPLSMQEAVSNAIDLLAAGHETTSDLIGNGMSLLMDNPGQMADLVADASLVPGAVEEFLRMEAPVRGMFRTTTRSVEIGGAKLPSGARVFALFGSGNRDEAEFQRPDELDIRRKPATQLGFGKGIHFCVGQALARLEGRVAFELLLRRLPNVRPHRTLRTERRPYLILRGFEKLPVEWDTIEGRGALDK
jgi:cytochrome P450